MTDLETLQDLNRNYVRSVLESDVGWFDTNLAPDFMNSNPDGSAGAGRYTDVWQLRKGRWLCVSANVSRG